MSDIVVSKGIRSNLLQLQNTASNIALTQNRLATGKKVNSALDNPSNFFTASSLNSRANDLSNLLDGLSNGIKVLEAADNGLTAITKTIESLQSTVRQARQDKTATSGSTSATPSASFTLDSAAIGTTTAKTLTISGSDITGGPAVISLNSPGSLVPASPAYTYGNPLASNRVDASGGDVTFQLATGSATHTITPEASGGSGGLYDAAAIQGKVDLAFGPGALTAKISGNNELGFVTFAEGASASVSVTPADAASAAALGFPTGTTTVTGADSHMGAGYVNTVDEVVSLINTFPALQNKVTASNDGGKPKIVSTSGGTVTVGGVDATSGTSDGSSGSATVAATTSGPSDTRKALAQ